MTIPRNAEAFRGISLLAAIHIRAYLKTGNMTNGEGFSA